jgi:hypothetical protein
MSHQAGFPSPSAQLISLLGGRLHPDDAPAQLLGVEHEYALTDGAHPLDFRRIINDLSVSGRRLDPGDANAYRLGSGIALTCDDAEAEVALPPITLRPGFTRELEALNQTARAQLETLLPPDVAARGYSTHVSAALPSPLGDAAGRLYATTFGPALMLLAGRRDAYGVFIRPRPRRLEFCSEYIEGPRLGPVATFVAGSVRACAAYLSGAYRDGGVLPPLVETQLRPSDRRYGYYVSRRAYGNDLYDAGRDALLLRRGGGTITAREQLELAWQAARATLVTSTEPNELRLVDELVRADTSLPFEEGIETPATPTSTVPSVFGAVTLPRQHGDLRVCATLATWDFTVFELALAERRAYVCIPREYLPAFLAALDGGRLDSLFVATLRRPPGNRVLENRSQTRLPAIWDRIGRPRDLLAPERASTGELAAETGSDDGRSGKLAGGVTATGGGGQFNVLFVAVLAVLALASVALGYLITRDDTPQTASAVADESPTALAVASFTAVPASTLAPSPIATATVAPTATATATFAPTATQPPPTATAVVVAPVVPTATPLPPTATPVPPNLVAGIGPIGAIFNQAGQATTYSVLNAGPGLSFTWAGPDCGNVSGGNTNAFTWSHPHPPCDASTNHANVVVQVIVVDGANNRVRCFYQGAAQGAGLPCEPF